MPVILTLNPGSNSLKADVVEVRADQRFGCQSHTRTSVMVENIGKDKPATFSRMRGRETAESHDVQAKSFTDATGVLLDWLMNALPRPVYLVLCVLVTALGLIGVIVG